MEELGLGIELVSLLGEDGDGNVNQIAIVIGIVY